MNVSTSFGTHRTPALRRLMGSLLGCALAMTLLSSAPAQSAAAQSAAAKSDALAKGVSLPEARAKAARLASSFRSGQFRDGSGAALPYRYFEPAAQAGTGESMPVVLYLHGEGEAGTDNRAQVSTTECATVWIEPDHLAEHPVYVLAPQLPAGQVWTSAANSARTLALLDQFLGTHPRADRNRIYLVGFSMGATGVYDLLLKHPRQFAAAMPISGSADAFLGDAQAWAAVRNTPVIIVHAYDDRTVPVSAALNAAAALQAGGSHFLGYGAPTPALWSPGSTPSPHDAWYTAFEKFEVLYNSLFLGDLSATHNGQDDLTAVYTSRKLGDGVTQVWDYALGTSFVIERPDKAVMIDATMGHGSIYRYIHDNVLVNKDVPIEIFLTHQHQDHTLGLASFVGASQLKKVYVHAADSQPILQLMGPDAAKVTLVKDGDTIPLGDSKVEVIGVPGHTAGSIVMKYGRLLFSGDSVGTGYVGVGAFSVEQYVGSVQHLLDRMGPGSYTIYGGHTGELRGQMTERYVHDLLADAQAVVAGTVEAPVYWRGRDVSTRKVSTLGGASITYGLVNVHRIPAALNGLRLSQGTLYPGYSPEFSPLTANTAGFQASTAYYNTWVSPSLSTIKITASVLDPNYRSLTVNGAAATSGQAAEVKLDGRSTRVAIVVTAADGATRTYTVNVVRGEP